MSGVSDAPPPVTDYSLSIRVQKGAPEQAVPLETGKSLTVGRSPTVELTFDDKLLSRCHCVFDLTGAEPRVTDLGSRNGTYVNGRRIQSSFLKESDVVRIGSLRIEVTARSGGGAEATSSTTSRAGSGSGAAPAAGASVPLDAIGEEVGDTVKLRGLNCGRCGLSMEDAMALSGNGRVIDGTFYCPNCVGPRIVEDGLGKDFRVCECLGAGGMGAVYRAEHRDGGQELAIKILVVPPGRSLEVRRRRFLREARIGLELDHPNIVKVHRWSFHDEYFYIAMDYVAGRGLEVVYARRPASAAEAVDISAQVLEALEYAHGRGVIHRDIKPANILLSEDGQARLVDFGLAKHNRRASMTFVTEAGRPLGTVHFMPPEQVTDAKRADARSDLYSLGATLYKCLSGEYPILANTHSEFLIKILEEEPQPLEEVAPHVPEELGAIVRRAMAKDPDARFDDAAAMRAALLELRDHLEDEAEAASAPASSPPTVAPPARPGGAAGPISAPGYASLIRPDRKPDEGDRDR